jgi:hypothetical protein
MLANESRTIAGKKSEAGFANTICQKGREIQLDAPRRLALKRAREKREKNN